MIIIQLWFGIISRYSFCDKLVSAVDNMTGNVKLRSSHFTISVLRSRRCRYYPSVQLQSFYCKPSTAMCHNNIISEDPRNPISLKGSNTKSRIIIKLCNCPTGFTSPCCYFWIFWTKKAWKTHRKCQNGLLAYFFFFWRLLRKNCTCVFVYNLNRVYILSSYHNVVGTSLRRHRYNMLP